jgi:hypothetical protein
MDKTVVDAKKAERERERVDRGIAAAAIIAAIPPILWAALVILLFAFIGMAVFYNHNQLGDFTNQVLTWFFRILALIGGYLLIKGLWRVYKFYHDFILDLHSRRTARAATTTAQANANKALEAVEQAKLKNEQLRAIIQLQQNIPLLAYQLADQGYHIEIDAAKGVLKAQNIQGLAAIQAQQQAQIAGQSAAAPQLRAGKPLALPAPRDIPGPFDLLGVFQRGDISPENMFIGALDGHEPFYIDAYNKLCHGAINAVTGRGKTIIKRGLEAQLLAFDVDVIDLDLKFTLTDENGLDYRPFAKHLLAKPPIEVERGVFIPRLEINPQRIARVLQWFAEIEVPRRLDLYHHGRHEYNTVYVFIEEMLYLVQKCPEVIDYLEDMLPVARSLGIKVFVSAQNFQVQSIQLPGGLRENFETAWYPGGDDQSGAKLLDIPQAELTKWLAQYSITLGKGLTLLRNNFHVERPRPMRVGMASNEAVWYLLGRADTFTLPKPGQYTPLPDTDQRQTRRTSSARPEQVVQALPNTPPVERHTGPLVSSIARNAQNQATPTSNTTGSGDEFRAGPDDYIFTPEQAREFMTRYTKQRLAIKDILRQMNNGEGLSNRYSKHASFLIEKYGLRKQEKGNG